LIYEDSRYDPKTSVSGYEALKMKGVKIIIADGSPVVAAIREKAVQDGILVFAQSATTPAFTDNSPLTCRIGLTADILGGSISDYAKNNLNYKKIALLSPNNEYGKVMVEQVKTSFELLGGKVVDVEIYDQASGDLRSNILKLTEKQKEIDALVVINNITPEPMFNQLKEMGWTKPIVSDIWTITSPNLKNRVIAKDVKFVDYLYSPQADLDTNPAAANYSRQYTSNYKASPILLGALTYDSYNILSKAINEVGGNPQKIAEYLPKMGTFTGITGDVVFDSSCQNINKKLIWRKVNADGTFGNL
jgi:ABC-type branched-subunit amino acid transport system substrate-binding protein